MVDDAPTAHGRVGFCAILGLPNVGKSTLLNRILGMRIAAVSAKPQTTRNRVIGVKNLTMAGGQAAQIIFVDTPGLQHGTSALRRYMKDEALAAAGDCDIALLMIDLRVESQRDPELLAEKHRALVETVSAKRIPIVLALNKVDCVPDKEKLLPLLERLAASGQYMELVPISARTGSGVDKLQELIAGQLPSGPQLYPEEMVTDRAERFLVGEMVREQLFRQLGQEIPYATAVVVDSFRERTGQGDVVIDATIYVERESQKGIVVGKGGQRIKSIGERARATITNLLGCPAHLKLYVKVSADWARKERAIRDMGYK